MFAVVCPYCTFRNERGARFCADCGAPLHLKPCPKCSKVDDVMVRQCLGCGTAFPQIELYDPETGESIGAPPPEGEKPSAEPTAEAKTVRHTYGAGPLIAVALVAGALPTLWMNRHLFPQPKAWRTAPVETPVKPPEPPAAPAPSTAPASPVPAPAATVAPTATMPAMASSPEVAAAGSRAADSGEKPGKEKKNAAKDRKRDEEKASQGASASIDSPRPCTESLVALGLCEKSQIRK